jgi:hypothetical protein
VTDYDQPAVVSIPFCTRKDMHTIAAMVGQLPMADSQPILPAIPEELETPVTKTAEPGSDHAEKSEPEAGIPEEPIESRHFHPEVIPFERRRKSGKIPVHGSVEPGRITRETLVELVQLRKEENPGLTQAEIARRAEMSQSYLSRLLNGKVDLKDKYAQTLYRVLCENGHSQHYGHSRTSRPLWSGRKKAAG